MGVFSTVLTSLQSLISPRFVVASFFPALGFWFGNGLMLFWLHAPFRKLATQILSQATVWQSGLLIGAAFIAIAMSAYTLSAVMPSIQSLLEGNWPDWIRSLFAPAQSRHQEAIVTRLQLASDRLDNPVNGKPWKDYWQGELTAARIEGHTQHPGANTYDKERPSAKVVHALVKLRRSYKDIPPEKLESAVRDLKADLSANDADYPGPNNALENARKRLWDLIDYAVRRSEDEYRQMMTRRHFTFGTTLLAPTRMGNVGQTIQSYAVERYEFNFELLWSRMQRILQKDKDFGPIIQAAKTQLDFLLASCALTGLWFLVWTAVLLLTQGAPMVFFAIAFGGPFTAWIWYRAAVAQYRTFADVLRSSIDLFRFDLLNELHLPLPSGVLEERDLWNKVDALHVLYELRDLRYVHSKTS
jgi:hypothetical protein